MVRELMQDPILLSRKSREATAADLAIAADLLETLSAHKQTCVGMAANMIGICVRIIAFENEGDYMVMYNPILLKKDKPYEAEEGCLSLTGTRPCTRYEEIEVEYFDINWKKQCHTFKGWTAEIIQHEIDHCNGIII